MGLASLAFRLLKGGASKPILNGAKKTFTIATESGASRIASVQTGSNFSKINFVKAKPFEEMKSGVSRTSSVQKGNIFTKKKYVKAKTIVEAKAYAKTNLGIEKFDVPDIELANQVNYSLTKAYNKTGGKIRKFFDEVSYRDLKDVSVPDASTCPAVTGAYYDTSNKLSKVKMIINKNFYENTDKLINEYLSDFAEFGQLSKNKAGKDVINLCTEYRYSDTLNRYYRLYKQGKLTKKAKSDFLNLLKNAREEETFLINHKNSVVDFIKERYGKDLSNMQFEDYYKNAKNYLVRFKNETNKQLVAKDELFKTDGAVGVDGTVLHELGHSIHFQTVPCEILEKQSPHVEYDIAREISEYATKDKFEFVAEYIAGVLSGDKFSQPVKKLFKTCMKQFG